LESRISDATSRLQRVGVLALQGDFAAHEHMLQRLGVSSCQVRNPDGLERISGLIMPGGESTTMLKFLLNEGFIDPLTCFVRRGGAIFGTCAGAILLAREVRNPSQPSLSIVDLTVERNAYGRQVDSFIGRSPSPVLGPPPLEMVFIRAPVISRVGEGVETLAEYEGHPVLVRQGRSLVATFHPELSHDLRVHRLFIDSMAR
jgi:pyridoxal 5'-phosphate synthase pdxT subunit